METTHPATLLHELPGGIHQDGNLSQSSTPLPPAEGDVYVESQPTEDQPPLQKAKFSGLFSAAETAIRDVLSNAQQIKGYRES